MLATAAPSQQDCVFILRNKIDQAYWGLTIMSSLWTLLEFNFGVLLVDESFKEHGCNAISTLTESKCRNFLW